MRKAIIAVSGMLTISALALSAGSSLANAVPAKSSFPLSGTPTGVTASSARNVWVSTNLGATARWNGSRWQVVPTPGFTPGFNQELGTAGPRNAWAVGSSATEPATSAIMKWNGTDWTIVPSDTPDNGIYTGLAVASRNNAWAVGFIDFIDGTAGLAVHWNGHSWKQVPTSQSTENGVGFPSAVATTPWRSDIAWALFQDSGATVSGYGLDRWTGHSFKLVSTPVPAGDALEAVAVSSASNAWAVGQANFGDQTFTVEWNGHRWTQIASPSIATGAQLRAVATTSKRNAWAVGFSDPATGLPQALILHWNGHAWTRVHLPAAAGGSNLYDVTAISATDAWAVGTTDSSSASPKALILHWNGHSWK
jgi:hypothetical protein